MSKQDKYTRTNLFIKLGLVFMVGILERCLEGTVDFMGLSHSFHHVEANLSVSPVYVIPHVQIPW